MLLFQNVHTCCFTETFTSCCWLAIHSWGCFIIVHPFCRKQNTATYTMTFCDISRYEHLGSLEWQWQQSWQWFSSATYSLGICSHCLFILFSSLSLPPSPTQMLNTALLYFGLEDRIISHIYFKAVRGALYIKCITKRFRAKGKCIPASKRKRSCTSWSNCRRWVDLIIRCLLCIKWKLNS